MSISQPFSDMSFFWPYFLLVTFPLLLLAPVSRFVLWSPNSWMRNSAFSDLWWLQPAIVRVEGFNYGKNFAHISCSTPKLIALNVGWILEAPLVTGLISLRHNLHTGSFKSLLGDFYSIVKKLRSSIQSFPRVLPPVK